MAAIWAEIYRELAVIVLAAMPIIELKGAIPIAMAKGYGIWPSFWLSFFGSSLPAVPIILLLGPILSYLKRKTFLQSLGIRVERKISSNRQNIDKYGLFGLFFFVAIPLPGTGVWTGSALAAFLKLKFWPSVAAIILGNFLAGIIITLITLGFIII